MTDIRAKKTPKEFEEWVTELINESKKSGLETENLAKLITREYKEYGVHMKVAGARSFAKVVQEMRELQKSFFAGDKSILAKSKALEEKVDRGLNLIFQTYK